MKKWIYASLAVISLAMPIFGIAQAKEKSKEPPPFDADLYHCNLQVFSFHGDFLFWRVQEGALDYALSMTHSAWGPTDCYAQGNFQNATFHGAPGFRLSMSFFRASKYWEFWAQYTRLSTSGSNSAGKPSPGPDYLTGTWPQIFTNEMAKASSSIHMNYNIGDVLITRVFFPNHHLRLRMIGGGTVAWINQFWKVLYVDSGSFQTKIANRWNFIGGGLRGGTSFDWYWFTDIYMTGGATFAALFGSYNNISKQTTNFSPIPGAYNPSLPIRNAHFNDVRPAFQGQFYLGPAYEKNLGCQRFEFFVGYELNTWLNLQEVFHSTTGGPFDAKETWIDTGMIALQGLTARATYDF